MISTKPTLAERIEVLARSTSAPVEFVRKLRDLFSRKGIDLAESAAPFESWLGRAFARQAQVSAARRIAPACSEVNALRGRLAEINRGFRQQIEKLRGLRREIETDTRRIVVSVSPVESPIEPKRMVRGEWDLPIVPGPEGQH